jgi:hypothetical protein
MELTSALSRVGGYLYISGNTLLCRLGLDWSNIVEGNITNDLASCDGS